MRSRSNWVLSTLFLLLLVLPSLAGWAGVEPLSKLDEKRQLAQKPADFSSLKLGEPSLPGQTSVGIVAATLTQWAQQWDRYYSDNFGLRKLLVGGYRFLTVHALNTSLHPAVVIGKVQGGERWYFYNGSAAGDGSGFESSLGKHPYTDEEQALTAANLKQTAELLQRNGVKFVLMVVPDKQTVYPELLSSRWRPKKGVQSRLDQFWTATTPSPESGLIDLRPVFRDAKRDLQLYMATDTHWTQKGAFLAYQSLIDSLRLQDHGPPALRRDVVVWKLLDRDKVPGDCAMMMGLPLLGGEIGFDVILPPKSSTGRPRGHKILVFADSFIEALRPYLEYEYAEVVSVSGGHSAKQPLVSQELLNAHRPDAVLIEAVERYWTM